MAVTPELVFERRRPILQGPAAVALETVIGKAVEFRTRKFSDEVGPGVKELDLKSEEFGRLNVAVFPTYHPSRQVAADLKEGLLAMGGSHILRAVGYGSVFAVDKDGNKEAVKGSRTDLFVVVDDPLSFYNDVIPRGRLRVGTSKDPRFHAFCNEQTPNFYMGKMQIDGEMKEVKIGVIGYRTFLAHASGAEGYYYLAGRLQKAIQVPIIQDTTHPEQQQQIDLAINKARVRGLVMALGLVADKFDLDDLILKYIQTSYDADWRVEDKKKAKSLFNKNPDEYREMLSPMVTMLEETGFIKATEGGKYQKLMSPSGKAVRVELERAKFHAFRVNYTVNPLTCGIPDGVKYAKDKIVRTIKKWFARFGSNHDHLSDTRNSAVRGRLSGLTSGVAGWLLDKISGLDANHLTAASALLTAAGAILAARLNASGRLSFRRSLPGLAALLFGVIADGVDGSVSTEQNRRELGSHDTKWGGMWDAVVDRWASFVMGVSRMYAAHKRGDWFGELAAGLATATSPFSSLFRSDRESKGETVAESGAHKKDLLGFFGTQLGRMVLAIPTTVYPEVRVKVFGRPVTVPLQKIADTISIVSNIHTAIKRAKAGEKLPEPVLKSDTKEDRKAYEEQLAKRTKIIDDAILRHGALTLATGATFLGLEAVDQWLHPNRGLNRLIRKILF